jgi:hypothetical protein
MAGHAEGAAGGIATASSVGSVEAVVATGAGSVISPTTTGIGSVTDGSGASPISITGAAGAGTGAAGSGAAGALGSEGGGTDTLTPVATFTCVTDPSSPGLAMRIAMFVLIWRYPPLLSS